MYLSVSKYQYTDLYDNAFMNFNSLVPDEKLWDNNLEKIAYLAYEDQCTPANPRVPLVTDMEAIMKEAYKGN